MGAWFGFDERLHEHCSKRNDQRWRREIAGCDLAGEVFVAKRGINGGSVVFALVAQQQMIAGERSGQ
jgi:predicted sulfurtransferase